MTKNEIKMKKIYVSCAILILVFVMISCSGGKQIDNERILILKSFIKDIYNYKLEDSLRIKEIYFKSTIPSQDSFIFSYVIPLSKKDIINKNLDRFAYLKYKDIKKREQNISIEDGINSDDIYVVEYDKKPYMFILFSENKIKSFVTLNKGTYRYFVPL